MSVKTPLKIQSWEKAREALKDIMAFVDSESESLTAEHGWKCECDLCKLAGNLGDAEYLLYRAEEVAAESDASNDGDCSWCGGSGGGDVPCQCRHCNGSGIEPGRGR